MADILIVEDSPITARMEARTLSQAGHNCRIVHSAQEAVEQIVNSPPELMLVDYMLPDMDGLQLLKIIHDQNPAILVIIITGKGFEKLAADAIKAGARDYVIKQEEFQLILNKVVAQVLREETTRRELADKKLISERLQAQNELTFWMAHNFKNILSSASGYLDLIDVENETLSREKYLEYLEGAKDSVKRAFRLMDQLLGLTRLDQGRSNRIILSQLVQQALEKVKNQLDAEKFQYPDFKFIDSTDSIRPISLCETDIRIILEGLLQNAVEALVKTGEIEVIAHIDGQALEIKVRDNGTGMDKETLKKATEPMFSTKGAVGVGLGLSLVQAACRRHNGNLNILSAPGQGTTVSITWPLS